MQIILFELKVMHAILKCTQWMHYYILIALSGKFGVCLYRFVGQFGNVLYVY